MSARRRLVAAVAGALVALGGGALALTSGGHNPEPARAPGHASVVAVKPTGTPDVYALTRELAASFGADWVLLAPRGAGGAVQLVVVPPSLRDADADRLAATVTGRGLGEGTVQSRPVAAVAVTLTGKVRGFASDGQHGQQVPEEVTDVFRKAAPDSAWAVTGGGKEWTVTVVSLPVKDKVDQVRTALEGVGAAVARAAGVDPDKVSVRPLAAAP